MKSINQLINNLPKSEELFDIAKKIDNKHPRK